MTSTRTGLLSFQFLHELAPDGGPALLPPLLLLVRLRLDFVEAVAQHCVGGNLVGGLEDALSPVGSEGVGLKTWC